VWPFTAASRRQPQAGGDEDYILLDESEYFVLPDEDDHASGNTPSRAASAQRTRVGRWLAGLGLVLALGLLSTPFQDGRPVLATPDYRAAARHVALLEDRLAVASTWDAHMETALAGDSTDAFELANLLRERADEADAQARDLALRRAPQSVRVEHLALQTWFEEMAVLLRDLGDALIDPRQDPYIYEQLRARWENLHAARQPLSRAILRLREAYPQGVIP